MVKRKDFENGFVNEKQLQSICHGGLAIMLGKTKLFIFTKSS